MERKIRQFLIAGALAVILTSVMNAPLLWFTITGQPYQRTAIIHDEDRAYYLSRITQAARGYPLIGNSALFEHRNDISPNGFVELLTAAIMRSLHWSLEQTVKVTDVLFPFIIIFLTYLWIDSIIRRPLLSSCTLCVVWFIVWGTTGLLRESSPKTALLLPSAYLALIFALRDSRWQRIMRGLLIGLMLYTYHYHWTLLIVLEGLLVIHAALITRMPLKQVCIDVLLVAIPFILLTIPYGLRLLTYQHSAIAIEMWRRFGMIPTHAPSAIILQSVLILWVTALLGLRITGKLKDRQSLLLLLVLTAGLIVVNSNIITGKEAEFEGHYGRVLRMFTWTVLFLSISILLHKRTVGWISIVLLALIAANVLKDIPAQISQAQQEQAEWSQSAAFSVMQWLRTETASESVILAPYTLSSIIPVHTEDYVLMNYAARSFFVSDEELLERYAVQTTFFPQDREPIESGVQSVFGNYPGSLYSKTKRIFQLQTLLRKPFTKTIPDFIVNQDQRHFLEKHMNNPDITAVEKFMKKYRIDYLVTDQPIPSAFDGNFAIVASVGTFSIFAYHP